MRTALDRLYSIGLFLAAICMTLAALAVVMQILGRLVNVLVPSVPELAGFLLGTTIFLALAGTQRLGEHIRVTVLLERVNDRVRRTLEIVYRAAALPIVAMLTWYLAWLAYDSWDFGDRSAGMIGIPYWIPQAVMGFGALLLTIRFLDELVQIVQRGHLESDVKSSESELSAS